MSLRRRDIEYRLRVAEREAHDVRGAYARTVTAIDLQIHLCAKTAVALEYQGKTVEARMYREIGTKFREALLASLQPPPAATPAGQN